MPLYPEHAHSRRRGVALYAMVLLVTMLVVGAGLTLTAVARAQARVQRNLLAAEQAELLAQSGLELALLAAETDSGWRQSAENGMQYTRPVPNVGSINYTINTSAANPVAPADVRVTATASGATQVLLATIASLPHPALSRAVAANGTVHFSYYSTTPTIAGPVRANSSIYAWNSVNLTGNVSFETVEEETISNTLTPASYVPNAMTMPAPDLTFYTGKATNLADSGSVFNVYRANLTPTANTMGTANANGIYLINAGGRNVEIEKAHLKGTLVIVGNGAQTVTFKDRCWVEPAATGYPTVLIDVPGGTVSFEMSGNQLDDSDGNVDYNEDGDIKDKYSSSVKGLIWTNADWLLLSGSWTLTGSAIGEHVSVSGSVTVNDDAALAARLIPGFLDYRIQLAPGSVRQGAP